MIFVRHNVPGASLTTLNVGGPCATVVDALTSDDVLAALAENPSAVCIGGGSNLIIRDQGVETPIIHFHDPLASEVSVSADGLVEVGAGADWDAFVARTVAEGLAGLECTSGVPGSVGGALVQNLGAYGQEFADCVVSVVAY